MNFTVQYFIDSVKRDLQNWENGNKEIENGTFKYDGSMPKSCVDALYKHKIIVCNDVLDYLNSLPDKNKVISTNVGLTEEGSKYYEMINK